VNLGRGADGGPRVADAVLLANGDGRRDAIDPIDVGFLHALEKLPRVGRQRLDVPPLTLGINRVEGQRRFARTAHTGHDHQLADWQRDVDVLQVVRTRAAYNEIGAMRRGGLHGPLSWGMVKPRS